MTTCYDYAVITSLILKVKCILKDRQSRSNKTPIYIQVSIFICLLQYKYYLIGEYYNLSLSIWRKSWNFPRNLQKEVLGNGNVTQLIYKMTCVLSRPSMIKSLILPSAKCKPGLQGWINSLSGKRKHRIVSMALYELVSLYMNILVQRTLILMILFI